MEQTGKSEKDVRAALMAILEANSAQIAVSPEVEMTLLSAHAGEQVVVKNLRRIEVGLPFLNHQQLLREIHNK